MAKHKLFAETFVGMIPVETTWALQQYPIELKGILKKQGIFTKTLKKPNRFLLTFSVFNKVSE